MVKLLKIVTSKLFILCVLLILQLIIIAAGVFVLSSRFIYLDTVFRAFSIVVVIYILNKSENPSYKLAWIMPILVFPVFGGLLYLIVGMKRFSKQLKVQNARVMRETAPYLRQEESILRELENDNQSVYCQVRYLGKPQRGFGTETDVPTPVFPIYKNTSTRFLSSGEEFFEVLLEELEKAEHYIFMEYFIIEEGLMWNEVHRILRRKAAEGVDVRLVYDDIGCIKRLPRGYDRVLRMEGIKCRVFNPFGPNITKIPFMNNRDHRKITVIDGHTGFTGGTNLADEYINETRPFGRWKDASVLLRGEAVWSFTVMFMHMWNLCGPYEEFKYSRYTPYIFRNENFTTDGYVMPYSDSPLDTEIQAEMVYLNMINKATDYIYICTPYLIIDNELATGLMLAAKNGVDVRIMLPHKFDKWYVHICSQANYLDLIRAGVRIFEYRPGFLHSKTFVCDDIVATVGTVNLDYRSLYLHFECGAFLYKSSAVGQVKDDYLRTQEDCIEITEKKCLSVKFIIRLLRGILKVFAPLM